MAKNFYAILLFTAFLFAGAFNSRAAIGVNGVHDPSSIIKHNGVYHVWGTGHLNDQTGEQVSMVHLTSTDLVNWENADPVFAPGQIPAWTRAYVPTFGGIFWAPECVKIGEVYYLYYSVSMGQRPSAIGVTTSTDLVNWTDQGVVIYSDEVTTYGSIDPAVFADANGKYWMAFGSHLRGIWIFELDPTTGKRLNGNAPLHHVAGSGGSWSEHEAAFVTYQDGYYYLFYNVGICCALLNSTYNVRMGRSRNPTGPYLDKSGMSLANGGGTLSLASSGKYIGPGHYGVLRENGRNILSLHYYDGTSNGYPRLDIANLEFGSDGWPVVNRDLLPNGRYKIANQLTNLVWETAGCTGGTLQALVQNTANPAAACQEWEVTSVGNGFYKFKNAVATGADQVVDIPFCNTNNPLATFDWLDNDCQKFKLFQHANGSFVFSTSVNPDHVISLPATVTTPGTQLTTPRYSGGETQQWRFLPAGSVTAVSRANEKAGFRAYPNPASNGSFTLQFESDQARDKGEVEIIGINGQILYRQSHQFSEELHLYSKFAPGLYLVKIRTRERVMVQKVLVR